MRDGCIDEAMAQARIAEDALRECDLTSLTSVELTALVVERETQRRRQEFFDHALIVELVARGVAGEYARSTPVDLLVELLNIRPGDARARVTRAAELGPRRDLTGQPLGPILPCVSAAIADGAISAAHADVIIRATREVPDDLEAEFGELVEKTLTDYARHTHPGQLAKAAATILDRLDPDGQAPEDEEKQRRRAFGLRKNTDGTSTPYGRLTPEATGVWCSIFDSLAAPRPAEDGTADPRTADQRRHDALLDAGKRVMRSDLPHTGGATVTLLVMMQLQDFLAGSGSAVTSHGDRIAVAEILKQAADVEVIPVMLSDTGGVLSYGQTQRLATCPQRRVLTARDRGCSFPGCTRPPAWCQAHHVIAWTDGGPTDIANLTLLCGYHHRNFEALGWSCHMQDGVPMWTPPAWLDASRTPRRNTANHIDIDFDTG